MACVGLENQIRTTAQTKRIRPSEFFLDFDRLRSGYVTETQFFRVLWENLGIKLNEEEQKHLAERYAQKRDGRVNYRLFCDVINRPFDPNNMKMKPEEQTTSCGEVIQPQRPLSGTSEAQIEELLRSLQKYYKYRGINLRTSCEDFDRHHIGVIQESQFFRSFPRPPEVQEADVDLLIKKYRDPKRPGLLNYLRLHHDIAALGESDGGSGAEDKEGLLLRQETTLSDFLPAEPGADNTVQQIFDRMRVAVFKNGVRSKEFFKDYDKLRSGTITDNQFVCGLSLAVGKEAQLTRAEIQKVVEFYRTEDGRVRYKEFCDMMESAFNIPDLEKKPMSDVVRPPQGALGRNLPTLSDEEEGRLQVVLGHLSDQVRERRLMMYQYFKDYDRSKGYSRCITQTQFGRLLHFLSLNVTPEDFKLLCRKFSNQNSSDDVNYPAFVQTVDREFVNYSQDTPKEQKRYSVDFSRGDDKASVLTEKVSLEELMAHIKSLVLANRCRVCEFFQDFDPLRSGSITKSQFRRGLSDLGFSALGKHNLSDAQFSALFAYYEDPKNSDKALWVRFKDDVESVFTQRGLEKLPTHRVPPQEIFAVPKPGTMDWAMASDEHRALVERTMERLRSRTNQRRVLAKPVFQDFDKHNNGHVTRSQFRQCLTMLELHCMEDEMQALEAKFCNDTGFHYISFLQELQPEAPPKLMYGERLAQLRLTNQKAKLADGNVAVDLEAVMEKIKTKVYKERIRVNNWLRDYDKLQSGRILKANFRRALDLCKLELAESELAILEDYYQAPGYPAEVLYRQFSDDIESIFTTKNLEKDPMLEVQQYQPPSQSAPEILEPEMEALVMKCMERLAEKVRKNRIQLFPLFEDYDRVHNGTVSRSQFRRVLNELELASLVATEQEWVCLWQKFDVKVGGKDDVSYIDFCDMIYDLAHFEWRKP